MVGGLRRGLVPDIHGLIVLAGLGEDLTEEKRVLDLERLGFHLGVESQRRIELADSGQSPSHRSNAVGVAGLRLELLSGEFRRSFIIPLLIRLARQIERVGLEENPPPKKCGGSRHDHEKDHQGDREPTRPACIRASDSHGEISRFPRLWGVSKSDSSLEK